MTVPSGVSFARRCFGCGAMWLAAALAFQVFLKSEGLTETNLNEMQQRIGWLFSTPIMAAAGLAEAFVWPRGFRSGGVSAAVVCLTGLSIITLTRSSRRAFVAMICINIIILAVAVTYFVRFSRLSTGG